MRFAESIAEPEPEEVRPKIENAEEMATESQIYLEKLIHSIQNNASLNEGYFIYLCQNEDNSKNPYDLRQCFLFGENKHEGRQSQTPNHLRSQEGNPAANGDEKTPRDQNGASQNLETTENSENRLS